MLVKVYMDEHEGQKYVVFKALVEKSTDEIILPGGSKIGLVLIDTKKNLGVTKEAEPYLKDMFKNHISSGDDIGEFDHYQADDGVYVLNWLGSAWKGFPVGERFEGARDTLRDITEYILIEE